VTIRFDILSRKQTAHPTWYRGEHCNFNPNVANMRSTHAVEDFILSGWLPPEPFISPETKVTAFGSCFAGHISNYLNERSYTILTKSDANAYVVEMGEGIVNSYAVRQQFDWAFRGLTPTTELWHGYTAESHGYDEAVRQTTLKLFEQTEVFILTFGLSEVWCDEPTGEVFWRAVPFEVFDPERHTFRVTTVAENKANMRAIYDTIREFRPEAKIIFTLSPIPLVTTFRPVSCITANSVSKAILRSAIDELYREVGDEGKLFYWPSYEIVEQAFGAGKYKEDRRHIKTPILDYIMALFESEYCKYSGPIRPLSEARLVALEATGEISEEALWVARARNSKVISLWVKLRLVEDDLETAELVLSCAIEIYPDDAVRQRLLNQVRNTRPGTVEKAHPLSTKLIQKGLRLAFLAQNFTHRKLSAERRDRVPSHAPERRV
jgi:hypothetical protein